jgi:ABC-2 type transport system ATP-binding protein
MASLGCLYFMGGRERGPSWPRAGKGACYEEGGRFVSETAAIEVQALGKTYGSGARGHAALKGVSFSIPRGTAFGLIGPNGAGKTTLVKSLLGVLRPTSGSVRVLGGDPDDPKIRARLGYLPERLHLPPSLRPRQVLKSVAALKALDASEVELDGLLSRVGLADAMGKKVGDFSKGMRQRLGLACALVGRPELLVLDEPTDGIDPLGRVEVRNLLAEEVRRGATLLLNSHLLSETEKVCGRVGILFDGKLLKEGPLDELTRVEHRYRVTLGGALDAAALAPLGFVAHGAPGHFHLEARDPQALNFALDGARQQGALLLELAAEERDLEQVLSDALGVTS